MRLSAVSGCCVVHAARTGQVAEAAARDAGLLANAIGDDVLRVVPPPVLARADLDGFAETLPRIVAG